MQEFLTSPAWGVGLATVTETGQVLDVWYPSLGLGALPAGAPAGQHAATAAGTPAAPPGAGPGALPGLRVAPVTTVVDSLAEPPAGAADVYLRLHLLSHRLIKPHQANLEGIFGLLPNVAWTSAGPCPPDLIGELQARTRATGGRLTVYSVDKFPRMADYVVPSGVRIGDADRVRLGAHLASGTTVMHEGFVNFNAGTLGTSMIEGRVSAGVVVGDGSDVGGGSSIMGTLSGGGKEVVRVGERCLIGANAGIGISLGDDCIVEAGCYVTAGSKVTMADGSVTKASELSGVDGLLFWRNSVTGALEARPRKGHGTDLNAALHAND